MNADDLVLCGESKEDLKVMVGCFVKAHRSSSLKFNADKSKVMGLGWKEGLECESCMMEHDWRD